MKNSFFHFAAFFTLSLFMLNCQKTATPPQEDEIIDAVIIELPDGVPPFECTGDATELISTFYASEIANGACRAMVQNLGLTANSSRGTGIIIKNQAAYEKSLTCAVSQPVIDFENYFVLAGFYRHSSCATFKQHTVMLCDGKIVFSIDMLKGLCAGPNNVIFSMVAIKKMYITKEILIDMQFVN